MTAIPNPATKRPLDPSAVITRAFAIYRENVAVLLPVALAVFAIQAIVAIALGGHLLGDLVVALLTGILGFLFQGMMVEVARDVEDGVLDSSPGQLIAAVVPVILPLFVVTLLFWIAFVVGFFALVIPCLFVATFFAVVAPITVLERPGIFGAFGRSVELVSGNGLPVFGLVLFNFVLNQLVGNVAGTLGSVTGSLAAWLVTAIVAPFTALVVATLYLRLREANGEPPLPSGVATADGPLQRPGL